MQSFFVSSTFRDMQGERDALHRLVMPQLQEKARSCGEAIQFVDLRWGISTTDLDSDAGADKILGVCLEEIRGCKPYMIVLLGERYGWMPPPALLQQTAEKMEFSAESYEMSVTELEISYGMHLAAGTLQQCIFCLREPLDAAALGPEQRAVYLPQDAADRQRMERLRKKICGTPGANVLHYSLNWDADAGAFTGYDTFAAQLYSRLEALLQPQWQAHQALCWQQRQAEEERIVQQQHLDNFVGRRRELEELRGLIAGHAVTVLQGEGGCGKSALMARLCAEEKQQGAGAVLFSCGISSHCMSVEQLMRLILWQLGRHAANGALSAPDDMPEEELREHYNRVMAGYDGEQFTVYIDAIDQLRAEPALYESWFIPPVLSARLRLVASTTGAVRINPMALPTGKKGAAAVQYRVQPPQPEELRDILYARFEAEHKQVSAAVADRLLQNPCSRNMLGMEIMVRRLVMLGEKDFVSIAQLEQTMPGSQAIDSYLQGLIDSMSRELNTLIIDYFDAVCDFLAEGEQPDAIRLPLYIIAAAQHGFSADRMEAMAEVVRTNGAFSSVPQDHVWRRFWDPIRFALLRRYLGPLLCRRADGSVDFTHRLLRNALRSRRGMGNITCVMQWYLNAGEAGDGARLENILPFTRMRIENELQDNSDYQIDADYADYCFHEVIRDAGNLEDGDDPAGSAEGARQINALERSVLDDLEGPEGFERLRIYCRILDEVISRKAGVNHFTVWFFGVRITDALSRRGDEGRAMALCILCRIMDSLYRQRQRFAAGEQQFAENWQKPGSRLLLYYNRAQRMFAELSISFQQGLIAIEKYYDWGPQEIFERGCALADEYIAAQPEESIYDYYKAGLHIYWAKWLHGSQWGILRNRRAVHVQQGMEYARSAVEKAARLKDAKKLKKRVGGMAWLAAYGCGTLLEAQNQQLFGTWSMLQEALALCEDAAGLIEQYFRLEELPVSDAAPFVEAWGECLLRCFMEKQKKFPEHRQKAIDRRGNYYYAIARDAGRQLSELARDELARLAVGVGHQIIMGLVPEDMKKDGYGARAAAGFLVEKEGGYLQAQARGDFGSRWRWAMLLTVEMYYHSSVRPAQCVDVCRRALEVLEHLDKEASDSSSVLEFSSARISGVREYVQQILEKNIALLNGES